MDYSFSTVTVNVEGVTQATVPFSICSIDGELYYGAPATLYWEGMTARGPSKYTWCNIQGSHSAPTPVYGSMSGTAYHDTAFTIYVVLSDGSSYHVDGNRVNIIGGNDIEGAGCTVYYMDYPSESNIYQIDVYGREPYVPENDTPPQYYDEAHSLRRTRLLMITHIIMRMNTANSCRHTRLLMTIRIMRMSLVNSCLHIPIDSERPIRQFSNS